MAPHTAPDAAGGARPGLIWALALATGLPLTAIGAPNVALPQIGRELGASFSSQQWVLASYAILLAALQFSSGPIADRLGRRVTCLWGLALFCAGSAISALAPSAAVLIAARGLQGAGGALVITGALALLAAQTADEDRLRAVGLRSSVIAVSYAVGPLMGGLLVNGPGWRGLFAVDALIALPLAWSLRRPVIEPAPALAAKADWPGLTLLTLGLLAGVGAIIRADAVGVSSPLFIGLGAAGVAGVAAFAARDRRSPAPLLPGRLVRDRVFAATTVGLAGLYFAVFGVMVYLTQFLLDAQHRSATVAGLIIVPFAIASLLAVVGVTRYRGRLTQRAIVAGAFVVGGVGMWLLHGLRPGTSVAAMLPGLVLVGVATGVVNPTFTAGHLSSFSARDGGIAAGVNSSARQLGTALGTAALGGIAGLGPELWASAGVLVAMGMLSAAWLPARPLAAAAGPVEMAWAADR